MWGTRFLSAFLKVNPYFTVCLAVGFSGLAAVGFNHSATDRSLNRLIPLHLRSLLPDRAPDVITTDLQGMEHAREVIHTIPRPRGSDVPHEPSGFGHVLLSDPPRKTVQWQGGAPAGSDLPIDYGFVRDVPDQPRYDMNKPPEKTIDPPDVPSPPSPPAPSPPPSSCSRMIGNSASDRGREGAAAVACAARVCCRRRSPSRRRSSAAWR